MQTSEGLPALLVYKSGQIIGNFVKLEDTFGQDFFAVDVESFLIEWVLLTIIWDFYFQFMKSSNYDVQEINK